MKTQNLMNQLAVLTSVRDLELLELGLLKALMDVLKLPSIKLLTIDWEGDAYGLRGYIRCRDTHEAEEYSDEGLLTPLPASLNQNLWGAILQARDTRRRVSVIEPQECGTVYPLVAKDFILGYVLVSEDDLPNAFEFQLIEGILRVFHNYYLLLEDSQKDKLTGLLNRRSFDERMAKVIMLITEKPASDPPQVERRRRESESQQTFWLAVMDIDHFKRVNDTFGHVYGDEVLLLVSQIMKRVFRAGDMLFRFGGEEFIIILKAVDREAARTSFERFREAVANYDFPQVGKVTISLGAIQIGVRTIPMDLVGQADQALYEAKRTGRNRTIFFEDLANHSEVQALTQSGSVDWF